MAKTEGSDVAPAGPADVSIQRVQSQNTSVGVYIPFPQLSLGVFSLIIQVYENFPKLAQNSHNVTNICS